MRGGSSCSVAGFAKQQQGANDDAVVSAAAACTHTTPRCEWHNRRPHRLVTITWQATGHVCVQHALLGRHA
ncbi:MAG: hypothetical protein EOO65_02675 [Methanosarcinales archaeon]|nr:MAG: hypothetical protein EOO65_02675 [Methanosarcinales archaeon]